MGWVIGVCLLALWAYGMGRALFGRDKADEVTQIVRERTP